MKEVLPTIAVIGAGMAGLAAGRYLAQRGARVIVLEKEARLGGRVFTDSVEGFEIDAGAQFLANFYTHTFQLIRELGLQQALVRIPGTAAILRAGQLYGLWTDLRLIFTPLIRTKSKLALLRLARPLLTHWQELDVHAFWKAYRLDTCSVAEYARQELNEELLEFVFQPPLSGIFYWTPELTSQAMLFLLLKAGLNLKLYTLQHGLGRLVEAMGKDLMVSLNSEVLKVEPDEAGGYRIRALIDGHEQSFLAQGVVCSVPASSVTHLFPDLDARQQAFFQSIGYTTNAIAAAGVGHRLPSTFYGLFFPRREAPRLATAAIQSGKNPQQLPAGKDLVVLYPSGPAGQELVGQDDESVQQALLADLHKAGPAYQLGRDQIFGRVYRWKQALPVFDVGHFGRLRTFASGEIETGRIVFAGDYLGGPFVEGAITSGYDAARRLLSRM